MGSKSPDERRYEKNRQEILKAVGELLLEGGVDAISVRTLADKVDYSPAALYTSIIPARKRSSKRCDKMNGKCWPTSDIPPGISMADKFVLFGRNYVKFATEYPEYYLLIMSTTETGPERMDEFKENPAFTDLLQFTRVALGSR